MSSKLQQALKKINQNPDNVLFERMGGLFGLLGKDFAKELDTVIKDIQTELDKMKKETLTSTDKELIEKKKRELTELQNKAQALYSEFTEKTTQLILDVNDKTKRAITSVQQTSETVENNLEKTSTQIHGEIISVLNKAKTNIDKYQGPKGDEGDKGKDGSSDKPDEIVKKINKADKKISIASIFGLSQEIVSIKQAIRRKAGGGGGGGMGNFIHQSFNGNGSITSFTLSNGVASEGRAIFVRYQGQLQVDTTHYSVSGKTLSLTFTPKNNSFIDVTYVRT